MHGLINKSLQCFMRDSYGADVWVKVAARAGADPDGFEAMLSYPDVVTHRLISSGASLLELPDASFLEDLGTYLAGRENLRRLLRFGGRSYRDFLHSLEELPGRTRMALPDLEMPVLMVEEDAEGRIRVDVDTRQPEWLPVLAGLIRAMADDYGALVLTELVDLRADGGVIEVQVLDTSYTAGRAFELTQELGFELLQPEEDANAL